VIVNFVMVPGIALGLNYIMDLDEDAALALFLLATAAGAPMLPKLALFAEGDVALSVGAMLLLMTITIGFLPLLLPILYSGVHVDPWPIALSLIETCLLPLAVGIIVPVKPYGEKAGPYFQRLSNLAIFSIGTASAV